MGTVSVADRLGALTAESPGEWGGGPSTPAPVGSFLQRVASSTQEAVGVTVPRTLLRHTPRGLLAQDCRHPSGHRKSRDPERGGWEGAPLRCTKMQADMGLHFKDARELWGHRLMSNWLPFGLCLLDPGTPKS